MNTPTNNLEILIPKFRWDKMLRDLALYQDHIQVMSEEKRRLCEVIALLILASGDKITVSRETMERFNGKLEIQILSTPEGGFEYSVRDPLKENKA